MGIALSFIASLCLLGSTAADAGLSKREQRNQRQAQKLYVSAMESIRGGEIKKSQTLLDNALRLDPHNLGALTARELLRQQQNQPKISQGQQDLAAN